MKIGYARISKNDGTQSLDLQKTALKEAGCEKIMTDEISGSKDARPGLDTLLEIVRDGDIVIIWALDRLGRSLKHLLEIVEKFHEKNIHLQSLKETIDTSTAMGNLIFQIFGAIAECERSRTIERTNAGLQESRRRGIVGGRNPKLSKSQINSLPEMMKNKSISIGEICKDLGITRATLYRYVTPDGEFRDHANKILNKKKGKTKDI